MRLFYKLRSFFSVLWLRIRVLLNPNSSRWVTLSSEWTHTGKPTIVIAPWELGHYRVGDKIRLSESDNYRYIIAIENGKPIYAPPG